MVDEQSRPLAVTSDPIMNPKPTQPSRRKCYTRCIICSLVTLFLFIITIVVLFFTLFKVKDPIMTLNTITFDPNTTIGSFIRPGSNISTTADVSVKNPNLATFKYQNTTSSIYYKGMKVGEAYGPSGQARAQGTARMNVTIEIVTERIIMAPNVTGDIASGLITMDSYTRVPGKVNVLVIIKRNVVVEMNCTVSINITSQGIQDQSCQTHVDF